MKSEQILHFKLSCLECGTVRDGQLTLPTYILYNCQNLDIQLATNGNTMVDYCYEA